MNTEGDDADDGDYGYPAYTREDSMQALRDKIKHHRYAASIASNPASKHRNIAYAEGYEKELKALEGLKNDA